VREGDEGVYSGRDEFHESSGMAAILGEKSGTCGARPSRFADYALLTGPVGLDTGESVRRIR